MSGTVDSNLLGDGPYRIGHLTLNAPQSLNSLTRDMVEILLDSLLAWRDDETVAAVFIDGIGDKAVVQLHGEGLLNSAEQLFNLDYNAIAKLEGWGDKSVDALRDGIAASLEPRLDKFLSSLGIPDVGPETSRVVCAKFNSIDSLLALSAMDNEHAVAQLSEIEGVGKEVAGSLLQFVGSAKNRDAIKAMIC